MRLLLVLLTFSSAFAATHKEVRSVTDKEGKEFTCTYKLFYKEDTVVRTKSTVNCLPNTNGKVITENIDIPDVGTFAITHTIKKGKDKIQKVSPVETNEPEPESSTEEPSPEGSTGGGNLFDCTCKLPDSNTTSPSPEVRYLKAQVDSDSSFAVIPVPLSRGGGGGGHYHGHGHGNHGLSNNSGLRNLLKLAAVFVGTFLAGLGVSSVLNALGLGRSLPINDVAALEEEQARLLSIINDRQLLGNILGNLRPTPAPTPAAPANNLAPILGLLGGASGGSSGNTAGAALLGSLLSGSNGGSNGQLGATLLGSMLSGSNGGSNNGGSNGQLGATILGSLLSGGSSGGLGGNLLGSLLGGSSGGSSGGLGGNLLGSIIGGSNGGVVGNLLANFIQTPAGREIIIQLIQQQLTNFIANGGIQNVLTSVLSRIDFEQLTEDALTLAEENQEEMEQAWSEVMSNMNMPGNVQEMISSGELEEMIAQMEVNLDCKCSPAA